MIWADMDWKLHRFHVSKNMGSNHYLPAPKQNSNKKIRANNSWPLVEGQTQLNLDIAGGGSLPGGVASISMHFDDNGFNSGFLITWLSVPIPHFGHDDNHGYCNFERYPR